MATRWIVLIFTALFVLGMQNAGLRDAQAAGKGGSLERIERYLNSITTLKTDFVAEFPDGYTVEGKAYLSRPGKMHLDYDSPLSILVIADGTFLIHYDKKQKQASWVGLSEAPLVELLVRSHISLDDDDIVIRHVEEGDDEIGVAIRLPNAPPESQNMTLIFSRDPMRLVRWIEEDTQHGDVVVHFHDMEQGISLSPDLFIFKDPRFQDPLSPSRRRSL